MGKRLIAILRDVDYVDAVPIVQTLLDNGINELEISLSSEQTGLRTLKEVSRKFGDKVKIGVGTVVSIEQLEKSIENGANFIITPAFDPILVSYCIKKGIEIIPGVFTPGDVMFALNLGVYVLKLFPANALPMNYIKTLSGPFPKAKFLAVGGVSIDTVDTFLANGFIGLAPGSDLVKRGATVADLRLIAEKARNYVAKCKAYDS